MIFGFLCNSAGSGNFNRRWKLLLYLAAWTSFLTVMVAAASLAPELAFMFAMSPSSSCGVDVGLPLDGPWERFCFPSQFLKKSRMDFIVPPVFAALIVIGSACMMKASRLCEHYDAQEF